MRRIPGGRWGSISTRQSLSRTDEKKNSLVGDFEEWLNVSYLVECENVEEDDEAYLPPTAYRLHSFAHFIACHFFSKYIIVVSRNE